MSDRTLNDILQPYPDMHFIFVPPVHGNSRTWIYRATEEPQAILDFHFSSLMTHGWKVVETSPRILAEREGSDLAVSASRRQEETRIVYEFSSREH